MLPTARHALIVLFAAAAPFGTISAQSLSPYDVFVFNDIKPMSSEVNQSAAVGRGAGAGSYESGRPLSSDFFDYSLFAGGNLFSPYSATSYVPPYFRGSEPVPTMRTAQLFEADGNAPGDELNFIGTSPVSVFQAGADQPQSGSALIKVSTPLSASVGDSPAPVFDDPSIYQNCTEIATSSACLTGATGQTPAGASATLSDIADQSSLLVDGPDGGGVIAPDADAIVGSGDGSVAGISAPTSSKFQSNFASIAAPVIATPEPATLALVGTGFVGLIGLARRKRAVAAA